jgi:hypothetical protein
LATATTAANWRWRWRWFRNSQVGIRVDQAGVDSQSRSVDYARVWWSTGVRTDCGDQAIANYDSSAINHRP